MSVCSPGYFDGSMVGASHRHKPGILDRPDDYILLIVEFLDGDSHWVHYIRQPCRREPDFGVTSVNYEMAALLAQSEEPS